MPNPIFITFEGIDGSGKTTQAQNLHHRLKTHHHDVLLLREPGSTPLGDHLRQFLKGQQPVSPLAELLAFQASRAELVSTTIRPALDQGTSVVLDRYVDSSSAYQGGGRNLPSPLIHLLNRTSTEGLYPHITFLLSINPDEAAKRSRDSQSRFESQDPDFHQRVAALYQDLAYTYPHRIKSIDATAHPDAIADQIWQQTLQALNN